MNDPLQSSADQQQLTVLTPPGWVDYALLDSGAGLKLERYGRYIFVRPEPQAMWPKSAPPKLWASAQAVFEPSPEESGGHWRQVHPVDPSWTLRWGELKFQARLTAGRHLGVFPEQASQWQWLSDLIHSTSQPTRVLNLFGYTGLATLAAAQAGAAVTHVDASKKAVSWARENQALSGLSDKPIRWLVDDAVKFVEREVRRGSTYEGIILDPPKFGRGPKGEVWEFFDLFPRLLDACRTLLSPQPLFLVVTAYAIRASALSLHYSVKESLASLGGQTVSGELALRQLDSDRLVPTAIFTRWHSGG